MNRDKDALLDIVEMIDAIQRHEPKSERAFMADEVLHTAVLHWIQTIGEAANRVSDKKATSILMESCTRWGTRPNDPHRLQVMRTA